MNIVAAEFEPRRAMNLSETAVMLSAKEAPPARPDPCHLLIHSPPWYNKLQ
jgi:hypothetical protein